MTRQVNDHCAPGSALIEAKFRELATAVAALPRSRLLERLEANSAARLILLRAPAGYGKTTLLAQWRERLAQCQVPHGWLSLDGGDRAPGAAYPYIVGALKSAGFRFDARLTERAVNASRTDALAAARSLVGEMRAPAQKTYLLIDGLDDLVPGAGIELIELLLRYIDNLQIVATTQRRPPLPLASLRAAGLLHEIGSRDLRFSPAEVESLFDGRLPARYAHSLFARTDGVAVALRFAHSTVDQRQWSLTPWTEWLDEYYREQILDALPPDLQPIVSRLVVVERFDASLARAIVGRDISAELERLHGEESLLAIDSRTGLFQFPAMLRESLLKRLQWFGEDERQELHRRAEAWFASRGFLQEALFHALAANDAGQALSLFRQIGASAMVVRFGLPVLRAALEQMQGAVTSDRELFEWSRVLLLTQQGQTTEATALADGLEPSAMLTDGSPIPGQPAATLVNRESLIIETLLAAYADRRLPLDREQTLRRVAEQLADHEHLHQAFISNMLCWLQYERAEFTAADNDVDRAIAEFTADNGLYGSLFMHLHRIIIRFWQNRLEEALAEAKLVSQLHRLFFPTDGRLEWLCRVFEALVLFELGRLDETAALMHEVLDGLNASEGWFEAQLLAYVISTRVAAARGNLAAAMAILARGERLAAERRLPRLRWHLEFHRVDLLMRGGAEITVPEYLLFNPDPRSDPEFFTWRERFQAAVLSTRLAIRGAQFAHARDILEQMERQIAQIDVPRARTIVTLLRARLATAEGDLESNAKRITEAMQSFRGLHSIQLFEDEGIRAPEVPRSPSHGQTAETAGPPRAERDIGVAPVLTQREREILELISSGRPNKVIAHQIGLSEGTVKFHLRNIYRKLNAHNRVQALARRGPGRAF
jgi:LuxR family transcriptional regulator, maltose regulon positive regulatory protein